MGRAAVRLGHPHAGGAAGHRCDRSASRCSRLESPSPPSNRSGSRLTARPGAAATSGVVTTQAMSVGDAEAAVEEAAGIRADAEDRLAELRQRASTLDQELSHKSDEVQDTVARLARAQEQAQRLAVDAYMQGTGDDELVQLFDAAEATSAAWRRHMTVGRVDQAREAAATLKSLRGSVDEELVELTRQATSAGQDVADAETDLRQAEANESYAYEQLAEAREADAAARAAEAAAEARAQAESEAAALARAEAERGIVRSGRHRRRPPARRPRPRRARTPVARVTLDADPWEYLRQCESGGNYQSVSADGSYRGAYQFSQSTWEGVGGVGDPAAASPAEQDARAYMLYQRSGGAPWPYCGRYL